MGEPAPNGPRPVLAVDLDGVVCEFVSTAVSAIRRTFGCDFGREDIVDYDLARLAGVPAGVMESLLLQLPYLEMEGVVGAAEGLRALAAHYIIAISTQRPATLRDTTTQWLCDKKIPHDSLLMRIPGERSPGTKHLAILHSYALVDDSLAEVGFAAQHGVKAFLLDAPWNRCPELPLGVKRCRDWQEVIVSLTPGTGPRLAPARHGCPSSPERTDTCAGPTAS